MARYLARRLLLALLTCIFISVVTFAIIQLPPGDYVSSYVAQMAGSGSVLSQEEAAVLRRVESLRASEADRDKNMQRQRTIVERALERLEPTISSYGDAIDLGNIAVAVALAYLDFRFGTDAWRERRPNLAEWYGRFAGRKSFAATVPS